MMEDLILKLKEKADWLRRETLKLHKCAPETRIASSLSDVEIFVVLYYGGILDVDPANPLWEGRDRFIVSKGHGAVSLYPVLADLGFFPKPELERVCKEGSFLGAIPDTVVPGFETINGSLGHGLGVACGIAMALKKKGINKKVYVLSGDGELNEGSVWEGVIFAAFHKLDNLVFIIDNNKMSMLGYQKDISGLEPIEDKFKAFNWKTVRLDGHNVEELHKGLMDTKISDNDRPCVLIADTVKGKGVAILENDLLSHVKIMNPEEVDEALGAMEGDEIS